MKKYFIKSTTINNKTNEELDEKEFLKLKKSFEILNEILMKKNIYNIMFLNYYDFRKEESDILLNFKVLNKFDYAYANSYLIKLEQRILNLLSSITFYMDSFKNELNKYTKYLESEFSYIDNLIQKDELLKFLKYLRNHLLHNSLLIDNYYLDGNNIKINVNKKNIKARGYTPSKLNEEEIIDLNQNLKKYLVCISEIHHQFRLELNEKLEKSRDFIENTLEKYKHTSLELFFYENDLLVKKIPISLYWDNIRIEIQKRNKVPLNIERLD